MDTEQVAAMQAEIALKQRDCESDLAKAEPSLAAAVEALNTLNKVQYLSKLNNTLLTANDFWLFYYKYIFIFFTGESYWAESFPKPSSSGNQCCSGCDGAAGSTRACAKGSELEGGAGLHGQG